MCHVSTCTHSILCLADFLSKSQTLCQCSAPVGLSEQSQQACLTFCRPAGQPSAPGSSAFSLSSSAPQQPQSLPAFQPQQALQQLAQLAQLQQLQQQLLSQAPLQALQAQASAMSPAQLAVLGSQLTGAACNATPHLVRFGSSLLCACVRACAACGSLLHRKTYRHICQLGATVTDRQLQSAACQLASAFQADSCNLLQGGHSAALPYAPVQAPQQPASKEQPQHQQQPAVTRSGVAAGQQASPTSSTATDNSALPSRKRQRSLQGSETPQ